ncbi:MAG: M14 family zinc carboxypeptidase [Anaerolineae bacterium]
MRVTSDFPCGNGKGVVELAPGHFRIEEVGEKAPYCKYFCARADAGSDGGRLRLEVYPDPLLGEEGRIGMLGHYPSQIWFSIDDMHTWKPTENVLENSSFFGDDHLSAEVRLEAGARAFIASNPVVSYSALLDWVRSMEARADRPCTSFSVGMSHEGREIPVLHLPASRAGASRVFIISGQHPSEHCGVAAAMGVAEFLTSNHRQARELRLLCDFWVCPMVNVDGNVHGRNGWNMQDVNMCTDFSGAASGAMPRAVENRLLWQWLGDEVRPHLSLHFHGYLGKRDYADPPYDGLYALSSPEQVFADTCMADTYRSVLDSLMWDTDGNSGHGRPNELEESFLDYQLGKTFSTVPAFYEINHGYHGIWASKRKGAGVLRAALETYLSCRPSS